MVAPISANQLEHQEMRELNVAGIVLDENGEIIRYVNSNSREGYNGFVTLKPGETFQTYQYESAEFIGGVASFSTSSASMEVTVTVRRSNSIGGSRTNACSYIASPINNTNLKVGRLDFWGCEANYSKYVYYDVIYKNTGSTTTRINFQVFYDIIVVS